MLLARALVASLALLGCGKPLRNFGDGGIQREVDATEPPLDVLELPDASLVDAPFCTALTATGPVIAANVLTGGVPPITGGVIDDGTYLLTKVEQTGGTPVYREVLRLTGAGTAGASFERADLNGSTAGGWFVDNTFTTITMTPSCPAPAIAKLLQYNYTPTSGKFQLVDSPQQRVFTYQRQP